MARLHFLDKTGLRLDYARMHARAVGGRHVGSRVPLRRGPARSTLIGTLSVRGLRAVQLLDGALTKPIFILYQARCLALVLVLDNLRVHHLTELPKLLVRRGVDLGSVYNQSQVKAAIKQQVAK